MSLKHEILYDQGTVDAGAAKSIKPSLSNVTMIPCKKPASRNDTTSSRERSRTRRRATVVLNTSPPRKAENAHKINSDQEMAQEPAADSSNANNYTIATCNSYGILTSLNDNEVKTAAVTTATTSSTTDVQDALKDEQLNVIRVDRMKKPKVQLENDRYPVLRSTFSAARRHSETA